jgi:hypothetical protein
MCGCDACGDEPGELVREFEADVAAVVRGDFIECRNRRGAVGFRIQHRDRDGHIVGSRSSVPRGRHVEREWPPWTPR